MPDCPPLHRVSNVLTCQMLYLTMPYCGKLGHWTGGMCWFLLPRLELSSVTAGHKAGDAGACKSGASVSAWNGEQPDPARTSARTVLKAALRRGPQPPPHARGLRRPALASCGDPQWR